MGTGEAALLNAARRGDGEAFGRLIKPHIDSAYRMAWRMVGDPSEAEDVVQEALYKAWRALPTFRGEAKFATWLYRIVWRECANRQQARRPLPLEGEPADGTDAHNPLQRLQRREMQAEVERALQQLSLPYRTVLTLFYLEDLPLREIADVLDLPLGTVKTHLHRARKALRKLLSLSAV